MFNCPNCETLAGEYPDVGVSTVVCANCTYKYELSTGTIAGFTSQSVEVRGRSEGQHALYARKFELTIAISSRETLRFTFGTERDDEWIRLSRGETATVVYSMRETRREELLFVVNRTTGERFILGTPNTRSKNRAALIGVLSAAMGGVAMLFLEVPGPLIIVGAIALGSGVGMALRPLFAPKHVLRSDERAELSARKSMLEEKRELLKLRGDVIGDVETRDALYKRLSDLRARMVAVKVEAYAGRIEAIDRALASLDAQLAVDRQLAAEYDRTLQIIEIEYDATVTADVIPTDGASVLEERLAELKSAVEMRAETTRRLSANAEVEKLLRSHSG